MCERLNIVTWKIKLSMYARTNMYILVVVKVGRKVI